MHEMDSTANMNIPVMNQSTKKDDRRIRQEDFGHSKKKTLSVQDSSLSRNIVESHSVIDDPKYMNKGVNAESATEENTQTSDRNRLSKKTDETTN